MKRGILFVLFLFTLSFLSAIEIKGVGRGKDEGESKRFALSDLSSFIEVEVQSKFESIISEATKGGKSDSKEFASTFVKTRSELPVLGVEYKTDKLKSEFYCEALLDASKALRLYEEKLFDIAKNIEKNRQLLAKSQKNDIKIPILRDLIKDLNRFNKFKIVAIFLESKNIPAVSLTEAELKNQILELSKNIDSIDSAAKKISEQIK
ncbi:MAG TPA: hypothetical protein PLO89_02940, partial [Spirochaetota bacterium]|nr:hypothetical protein [Spirochaetota bacterium]